MPSKSKKQHNFMEMVANNPKMAKKVGVPQSVGKDFEAADKGKKFGTGGNVNYSFGGKGQANKQRTRGGSVDGYQKDVPDVNNNKYAGMKAGGLPASINKQKTHHTDGGVPNFANKAFKGGGMATSKVKNLFKGKESMKEELAEAKAIKSGKISPMQYAKGEESEKKMNCGGKAKKMSKGGGIEIKGKTKGRIC